MKECPKCKKKYNDEFSFCNTCGERLVHTDQIKKKNNNFVVMVLVLAIVAVVGLGMTITEQKRIHNTRQEIENYKYQKAVQEYESTPTKSDLRVNSDWTQEKSGTYIYIKGSVTNISSTKTISYFAVEAKFYDLKGNIIDSDWTNDGDDLEPGETRKFEIMHKYDRTVDDIRLSIKDVN